MTPERIKLNRQSKTLELVFGGQQYLLSAEFLRVHSPSAEVRGHGPGQEVLQHGKLNVAIDRVQPCGHYALQLFFDDGHDSGIYSWTYLFELCQQQSQRWQDYLDQLSQAGLTRDPDTQVVRIIQ